MPANSPPGKWALSDSDRAILLRLKAEIEKEASAAEFARLYLPFGQSKLSKMLNAIEPDPKDNYLQQVSAETWRAEMERIAGILEDLPRQRELQERLNSQVIIELSQFRAVRVAVEECRAKESPERLVKYLAPTGGGKTMLCNYLAKTCGAKPVEARESWRAACATERRRSYSTALRDIASALSFRTNGETSPILLENLLIKGLSKQKTILAIDEAEFFGLQALNGLKLLLNRTGLVLVLCAIRAAHDRWNYWYPVEAEQLDRRTHAVIQLTTIAPADAAKFFPANQFAETEPAVRAISEAASHFGHYSLIRRVAAKLGRHERADVKEVKEAIRSALAQMNRTPAP
jgi:hypothetical protein